ncbi:hypothetical protein QE390_005175 [Siphonobacter sp. SORGH_AS 1065]|nr:hypothetical protein [Siphonobacter sp. SORGH_AS_1065]
MSSGESSQKQNRPVVHINKIGDGWRAFGQLIAVFYIKMISLFESFARGKV